MTTVLEPPVSAVGAAVADVPRHPGRLGRLWRGRPTDPAWVRPSLIALLTVTAALYLWDLGASGWANSFYSAAVEAGTKSWKAFFFGSFDSSSFITVDKPPAFLWVMELSARVFGLNSWSILVPNALEGVATVGVAYLAVRRWFGPAAGLLGGALVAVTPVAALMFRYNNPDALLALLLALALYVTMRGIEDGRTRWMALAGALLGFAFLTKMLQAFLVLPAIGAAYVLAAPGTAVRRVIQLVYGAIALVVAGGWWVVVVEAIPAADRPYIGSSQHNNLWTLIFGYNGFGRLTGNEAGSVGGGTTNRWGITGLLRLFGADMGSQISWLLPAALILLVAGLVIVGRAARRDRRRAALVLWGLALLVTAAVLSFGQGIIHPYYTVALAAPIGAVVAMGGSLVWSRRRSWQARAALSAAAAATAAWSYVLLDRSPTWHPPLRVAVLVIGLGAAAGLLVLQRLSIWLRRSVVGAAAAAAVAGPLAITLDTVATPHAGALPLAGPTQTGANAFGGGGGGGPGGGGSPGGAGPGAQPTGQGPGFAGGPAGAAGFGGAAQGLGGPTAGPGSGTAHGARSAPGAGGARAGNAAAGGLLTSSSPDAALVRYLERGAGGYRWMAATVGANSAAGYQLATDDAVMAIGGFNGSDPAPTLPEFEILVQRHEIHYFIADGGQLGGPSTSGARTGATGTGAAGTGAAGAGSSGTSSQITAWVESHFRSTTVGGVTVYDLTTPTSASAA